MLYGINERNACDVSVSDEHRWQVGRSSILAFRINEQRTPKKTACRMYNVRVPEMSHFHLQHSTFRFFRVLFPG